MVPFVMMKMNVILRTHVMIMQYALMKREATTAHAKLDTWETALFAKMKMSAN